jgi:hypothetical protein
MLEFTRSKIAQLNLDLKKSLKIPKGHSESVYRRRTDNTKVLIQRSFSKKIGEQRY